MCAVVFIFNGCPEICTRRTKNQTHLGISCEAYHYAPLYGSRSVTPSQTGKSSTIPREPAKLSRQVPDDLTITKNNGSNCTALFSPASKMRNED